MGILEFIEIITYRRDKESIICLWNHNESLYEIYCKNRIEELECLKKFSEIANSLVLIHKNLKELVSEDDTL